MKKLKFITFLLAIGLFGVSCQKKEEQRVSQNVVIDSPQPTASNSPNPNDLLKEELDADKKLNFSGKVFALSYLETHRVKPKKIKLSSDKILLLFFESDLNKIKEKYKKPPIVIVDVKPKNAQKSYIRLAFYWDKLDKSCYLRSQMIQNEIATQKDPYPLKINEKTCKKYIH